MPRTISPTSRRAVAPCAERKPESRSDYFCRSLARLRGYLSAAIAVDRSTVGVWAELHICPEISAEEAHRIVVAAFVPGEQTGQINMRTPSIIPLTSFRCYSSFCIYGIREAERKVRKYKSRTWLASLAHTHSVSHVSYGINTAVLTQLKHYD